MDLWSADEAYRNRSIVELQRVIDRTRELKRFFPKTEKPLIIINAGGFTSDGFLPETLRDVLYRRIGEALREVDSEGVEIIPQTMPPFPWHFGGQRYHNLFMAPDEIVKFCKEYGVRVCFDTSHSKLACNHFGWSWQHFIEDVGPYSAHLHIVDARGLHDEGLQIGTVRSILRFLASRSICGHPACPSSRKYGKGTRTMAKGSGWRSIAWIKRLRGM
jgi:N-acetylneuraminate synthase